jgi:hypothetical protein
MITQNADTTAEPEQPADDADFDGLREQGKRVSRASLHRDDVALELLADPDAAHPVRPGNGGRDETGAPLLTTVDPAIVEMVRETRRQIRESGIAGLSGPTYPPEVVEAIRREWIASVKSIARIATDYELPRTNILGWASKYGWGKRDDSRRLAVHSKVTAELVARAASKYAPVPGTDGAGAVAVMTNAEVEADPERAAQAMVDDYAAVVANVVQRMRDTSGIAVETGRTLLDEYRATLLAVMASTKGDKARSMKALGSLATTYKTIAAALHTAYQLQRQSYGLDATDGDAKPPGAGPEALGGTYEDAVREAEERGIALDS